jgi:hypothetical protein
MKSLSRLMLRLFLAATALLTPDHLGLLGQQLLTTQPIQRLAVHHSRKLTEPRLTPRLRRPMPVGG